MDKDWADDDAMSAEETLARFYSQPTEPTIAPTPRRPRIESVRAWAKSAGFVVSGTSGTITGNTSLTKAGVAVC